MFALIVDIIDDECEQDAQNDNISFRRIRTWIKETYNVEISNSSITMVKEKCGIEKLQVDANFKEVPFMKSKKEQLVLEAFKHFNIVQE